MTYRRLTDAEYADFASRILYEDNHLLVVCKKVGEIVQGDKTGDECLAESYKAFIAQRDSKPGAVFMGVPHRLDRPVSGICVLAKTSKALGRLSEMFREGAVHKTYWALCCSAPASPEGLLEDWLVRNEKQNKSYVRAGRSVGGTPVGSVDSAGTSRPSGPAGAKLARLKYRHIGDTDRYHLLEVELLTGRHHQIRCQLSHMGCPIKGDLKYGAPRSNPDGGICLHARQVEFIHPVRGEALTITAPVPSSWPSLP